MSDSIEKDIDGYIASLDVIRRVAWGDMPRGDYEFVNALGEQLFERLAKNTLNNAQIASALILLGDFRRREPEFLELTYSYMSHDSLHVRSVAAHQWIVTMVALEWRSLSPEMMATLQRASVRGLRIPARIEVAEVLAAGPSNFSRPEWGPPSRIGEIQARRYPRRRRQ